MKTKHFFTISAVILFLFAAVIDYGCKPKEEAAEEDAATEIAGYSVVPDIQDRLAQFAPTEISYDESLLNEEQKQVLEKLVMAAKAIDKIFWKQASHVGLEVLQDFENSDHPSAEDFVRYLTINFGPFDRLEENKPFNGGAVKPHSLFQALFKLGWCDRKTL